MKPFIAQLDHSRGAFAVESPEGSVTRRRFAFTSVALLPFVSHSLLQRRGQRGAGVDTETPPNSLSVMLRGPPADPERERDGGIRLPFGEPPGHFALSRR